MTAQEITALAREYAEFTDMSPVDKKNISAICECFLKYTLRRYCLVEKDIVREVYAERTFRYDPDRDLASIVVEHVLNRLFPEIAKEVEE